MCYDEGKKYLFTASYDETLIMWSLATDKALKVFEGHSNMVKKVILFPREYLCSASNDGDIKFWDI